MNFAPEAGTGLISRRAALTLFGAMAAVRSAGAADAGMMQPATLDHVNIRVTNVARSAEFYRGLFDTPVLRNGNLRARPELPPGEAFFLKMGDGYLVMSQAFAPDVPGLDHYSVGIRDYEQGRLTAKLRDSGVTAEARSADIWVRDLDGTFIQVRTPGGWARQTAAPVPNSARSVPGFSPITMSKIGLRSPDLARAGDFYSKLVGTEIASAASSRSRTFAIGDSALEVISVPAARPGLDHIRVAVKDFNVDSLRRTLRERGIATDDRAAPGVVRINDPDGIGVELAAAN